MIHMLHMAHLACGIGAEDVFVQSPSGFREAGENKLKTSLRASAAFSSGLCFLFLGWGERCPGGEGPIKMLLRAQLPDD